MCACVRACVRECVRVCVCMSYKIGGRLASEIDVKCEVGLRV